MDTCTPQGDQCQTGSPFTTSIIKINHPNPVFTNSIVLINHSDPLFTTCLFITHLINVFIHPYAYPTS